MFFISDGSHALTLGVSDHLAWAWNSSNSEERGYCTTQLISLQGRIEKLVEHTHRSPTAHKDSPLVIEFGSRLVH